MNKLEIQAFEYAVKSFNKILELNKRDYSYEIVWDTKFGPAIANTIIYASENTPFMQISFSDQHGEYSENKFEIADFENDFFAFTRHNVFEYFKDSLGNGFSEKLKIEDHPYYLMNKLIELSKINPENELKTPDYSSVWNFKTLDESIDLPFIYESSVINSPMSLVKNRQ
ncbi:hypothetical protein [Enterococcus hirae]|uniref:hypothetical protein n=1 Tax=Enterococcus hirae TaxID=1354 RepID=UPI0019DEA709|nr:hypothetical protein [Enterococcus hirae]MEB8420490.1 hypothetical protein [Enterococcus hirae]